MPLAAARIGGWLVGARAMAGDAELRKPERMLDSSVVTRSGAVFDEWDLRAAKRIAKRIAGVRRVVHVF